MTRTTTYLTCQARVASSCCLLAVGLMFTVSQFSTYFAKPDFAPPAVERPAPEPSMVKRAVYALSVIRGGVYTADDLRNRFAFDQQAQEHYSDFDLSRFRLVVNDKELAVYVSFRKEDRIYWTDHRVRVPYYSMLYTDGTHFARARCGNRISAAPMTPTAPAPPAPEFERLEGSVPEALLAPGTALIRSSFDLPIAELPEEYLASPAAFPGWSTPPPSLPPSVPPSEVVPSAITLLPPIPPIGGGRVSPSPRVSVVPEPSTAVLVLLGMGMTGIYLAMKEVHR